MNEEGIRDAHEVADELFERHGAVFGTEFAPYRHHVHRVLALVGLQGEVPTVSARPLGLAAFYHDAAIWFDDTWDYLPPSIERALAELAPEDDARRSLVTALIDEHHRVRRARHPDPLVEAFRRADGADLYHPLFPAPGAPRAAYRELVRHYPYDGFRPMLARAFLRGLRENPLRPAPMVKF